MWKKHGKNYVKLREVDLMTYDEAAALMDGMLNYWPNLFRGNDAEVMVKAWAVALKDIPKSAAARGCAVLALKLKFPPSVAEVVEASQEFIPCKVQSFDVLFARSCHDCLGFDTQLYKQMQQDWVQTPKRLKLN